MFNLKWGGAAGAFAFVLSLLIGLSGGGALVALIRALAFGVFFFIMGSLAYWLISRFLPELLDPEDFGEDEAAGSRVNIAVGDDEELGVPDALAQAELDGLPELGEKAPGLTGKAAQEPENRMALDQNGEDDYTKKGNGAQSGEEAGTIGFIGTAGSAAAVPVSAGDSPDSVDELPDLGSLSSAFLPSGGESDSEAPMPPPSMPEPPGGAAKKQGAGDFNLKEMASAIQTILKRD